MSQKSLNFANNLWSRFSVRTRDGSVKKMLVKELDKNLNDKFLDFFIENYASREKTHVICGLPDNKKALDEYRDIYKNRLERYSDKYKIVVCCEDDGRNEDFKIIGFSGIKLLTKDCVNEDITQFKTEEVKRLFDLDYFVYKLSPTPDLLKTLPRYYEDQGLAVLPEYSGLGLATELLFTSRKMATAYDVPMGGAWATIEKSVKASCNCGYKIDREIDPREISKQLGAKVKMMPLIVVYLTYTKLEEQYMECSAREYMEAMSQIKKYAELATMERKEVKIN